MKKDRASTRADDGKLSNCQRFGLIAIAVVLMGLAGFVVYDAYILMKWCDSSKDLVATVSDPQTPVSVVLVSVSILFLFLGVTGHKLSALEIGGSKVAFEKPSQDTVESVLRDKDLDLEQPLPGDDQPPTGDESPPPPPNPSKLTIGGTEMAYVDAGDLPGRVVKALFDAIDEKALPERLSDIQFGARKNGKGNHPWFVKFRGTEAVWKISFGGHGKTEATVTMV